MSRASLVPASLDEAFGETDLNDPACVTLHEIVRMRRFRHFAAPYLRIILPEIIKYAAITITPPTAGRPSIADVSSLKCCGLSQTARRNIISDGNEHFSSPDSTYVMRSDYQIKWVFLTFCCNQKVDKKISD